jgi:BirA family biotin operon repressor/biotin-[acetyl-CoA-carboxylase] ligase
VGKANVLRLGSVTSTQDVARELPVGSIVVADHQTAGRGRLDRRWEAPPGTALLVSFVLERNPVLSLAAGVAAAQACGPSIRLKWPNDLSSTTASSEASSSRRLPTARSAAIGINLTRGARRAAKLDQPRDVVLERLVAEMDDMAGAPRERVLASWRELSATLGRSVRIDVGAKSTEGLAEDLGRTAS